MEITIHTAAGLVKADIFGKGEKQNTADTSYLLPILLIADKMVHLNFDSVSVLHRSNSATRSYNITKRLLLITKRS